MLKPSSRHVTSWSRNASRRAADAPPAFARARRPTREIAEPALALRITARRRRARRGGRSAGTVTAARDVLVGVVAAVGVARPGASRRNRASTGLRPPWRHREASRGADRVIDRQRRQAAGAQRAGRRSARGPALEHLRRHGRRRSRAQGAASGSADRTLADVRRGASRCRNRRNAYAVANGPVARASAAGRSVDRLEPHLHLSRRPTPPCAAGRRPGSRR